MFEFFVVYQSLPKHIHSFQDLFHYCIGLMEMMLHKKDCNRRKEPNHKISWQSVIHQFSDFHLQINIDINSCIWPVAIMPDEGERYFIGQHSYRNLAMSIPVLLVAMPHSLILYLQVRMYVLVSLIYCSCQFQGKFLALLIIIPWTLGFVVHDYVLMPFLDRYMLFITQFFPYVLFNC